MSHIFVLKEVDLTLSELLERNTNPMMLFNTLAENNIWTLAQLLETSDIKLRCMPGVGAGSHMYIVDELAEHGLHLKVK